MATVHGAPVKYVLVHGAYIDDLKNNNYIAIYGWGDESVNELKKEFEEGDLKYFERGAIDSIWGYSIKEIAEGLSNSKGLRQYSDKKDIITTIDSPIIRNGLLLNPVNHEDLLEFFNAFPKESKAEK